jgi:hypothetical protein
MLENSSEPQQLPRHDDLENPPDYVTLRDDYWTLYDSVNAAFSPVRKPPQEWTQDDNCLISPTGQSYALNDKGTARRLKQAINAALGARAQA